MNYGKSIELYLADGTAGGTAVVELSNWKDSAGNSLRETLDAGN